MAIEVGIEVGQRGEGEIDRRIVAAKVDAIGSVVEVHNGRAADERLMVEAHEGQTVVADILDSLLHQSHLVGKVQEIIKDAGLSHRVHRQRSAGVLQFVDACTCLRHADRRTGYHDVLEIGHGDVRH